MGSLSPRALRRVGEREPVGDFTGVLGVDPSLRATGYALVQSRGSGIALHELGVIKCHRSWPRSRCLAHLAQQLRGIIERFRPEVCVVEGLIYARNQRSALILGEVRGALISVVAEAQIPIYELAPRRVKQAVSGYGAASKEALARVLRHMLELPELEPGDAADALAVAVAFIHECRRPFPIVPDRL